MGNERTPQLETRKSVLTPNPEPELPYVPEPEVPIAAGVPMFARRKAGGAAANIDDPNHDDSTSSTLRDDSPLHASVPPLKSLLNAGVIRANLEISQPGDPYELEADRVANQIMFMEDPGPISASPGVIQRKCAACEIGGATCLDCKEKEKIQRKESEGGVTQSSHSLTERITGLRGGGEPLSHSTLSFFEPKLGVNLGGVRVHTGAEAVALNKELGAHAFTHGSDIYFNAGKYDPDSSAGRRLLAHELTHTVQQGGAIKTKKQTDAPVNVAMKTHSPAIHGAWYNFDIPFTDYQFDPSLKGIKTAAGIVKDKVVEGAEWIVEEIKSLVNSGIEWLKEKWQSLEEFANSGWESLKTAFNEIISVVKSPLDFIANAILQFDANSLRMAWGRFSAFVSKIGNGFKKATDRLFNQVEEIWGGISGYATRLLDRVTGLTQNIVFRHLPDTLQRAANFVINQFKSLWKSISDGVTKVINKIRTWVDSAIDKVVGLINRVASFAIETVIAGIVQFGQLILFLKDLFENPSKYLAILADKSVAVFDGLENRFAGIVDQHFGDQKAPAIATDKPMAIQREVDPAATPAAKSSASWGEIGTGVLHAMSEKWAEFKNNPMGIISGLLLDMFFPIYGNAKDIIELFVEIKNIVTGPLGAGSLEEFWTSLLRILDIPVLIYQKVVSILMRSLMVPLIVATFIPHPLVKAIAAAVGEGLLVMFVEAELLNVGHKILLLKTGELTKEQKIQAYNRVADSLIAMIMTAAIIIVMLILHFIANVMKGIYNVVKGKFVRVEAKPIEVKGGPQEGKGGTLEGKGGEPKVETSNLKGEVGSLDGQRSINVSEKGKIWVCASPCEEIRLKYEKQIKENPAFEERLKKLEEGYSDLTAEQKAARDAKIKQLEQEMADIKLADQGGVRVPKEVKWPPEPPKGAKPDIGAPEAAEWRYQRYVYDKYLEGKTPKDVLPPDEWMRRYFEPTAEGGRPGRPGGPEQVAAKNKLKDEGIRIVEDVKLGERYPDGVDPKPNPAGGTNYFEVGEMLKSGIPEARERVKIGDEIKAMKPNDTVTFVDKTDISKRVTYAKGSTPENPTSRTFKPGE